MSAPTRAESSGCERLDTLNRLSGLRSAGGGGLGGRPSSPSPDRFVSETRPRNEGKDGVPLNRWNPL